MLNQQDDIRRAKQGNVAAFDRLIREYLPTIRRFAMAFASSQADADDLAQEAMVRAFRSIKNYRGDASFSTWLYRITRNAYVDRTRSRWFKFQKASVSMDNAREQTDVRDTPEGATLRHEQREYVWSVLRTLPNKYRNVLVLIDIEGLEYADVAKIEGVPIGTVRSRLSRGRDQLAKKIGRVDNDDASTRASSPRSLA
ncbi:MAG: sigma-70 family RNA polymerase sigma factor [Myxococcota bacterium]|nr:sigma-70 family RNA polymerase sigma factor [Myxococcota bacterium]